MISSSAIIQMKVLQQYFYGTVIYYAVKVGITLHSVDEILH